MQNWFSGCGSPSPSPSPSTGTSLLKEKANICESQCSLELFGFFFFFTSPIAFCLLEEKTVFYFNQALKRERGSYYTTYYPQFILSYVCHSDEFFLLRFKPSRSESTAVHSWVDPRIHFASLADNNLTLCVLDQVCLQFGALGTWQLWRCA